MCYDTSLRYRIRIGIPFSKMDRLESQICGDLLEFLFGLAYIFASADIKIFFSDSSVFFA